MNLSYFLYNSDGVYYLRNMPQAPIYCKIKCVRECGCDMIRRQYERDVNRAKAEAVRICDEQQEVIKKRIYDADPSRNTGIEKYFVNVGELFAVNINEAIGIAFQFKTDNSEWYDVKYQQWRDYQCEPGKYAKVSVRVIARIIEPKKQEESEEQMLRQILENYRDFLRQDKEYDHAPDTEESFIKAELEDFEIKRRKPL